MYHYFTNIVSTFNTTFVVNYRNQPLQTSVNSLLIFYILPSIYFTRITINNFFIFIMSQFNLLFLIDDDHPTNYYHSIVVKKSKMVKKVISFLSAKKALNYFREVQEGINLAIPEIIFLDINMPEVNAWDFLDIFEQLVLPTDPIIVILSTSINPKDERKANSYKSIYEFINKPLTVEYLKQLKTRLNYS